MVYQRATDWDRIRLAYLRGDSAYQIAQDLGGHPTRQHIRRVAKAEGWDTGLPGLVTQSHLTPHPNAPLKDSPAKRERILGLLRDGATYRLAAAAVGINESTLGAWRQHDPDFQGLCEAAQADFALGQLGKVRDSADTKDARFLLQHHPISRPDFGETRGTAGLTVVLNIPRTNAAVARGVVIEGETVR